MAAVGAVYAADQGPLEHCVQPGSCALAVADSTCPSGAVVIETAYADQVPAASNSSPEWEKGQGRKTHFHLRSPNHQ